MFKLLYSKVAIFIMRYTCTVNVLALAVVGSHLTLSVLHYYLTFSFHLKLALLTQLPTSNERKIHPHLKIKPVKFHNGGFTQDLYMHICSISVKFQLWKNNMNALKSVARTQRVNNNLLLFVVRRPFRCRHDVTLLSVELSWVWSVKHTFCFPKPKGDIYFTGSHSMWHNRKRHVGVSRLKSDNFQRIAICAGVSIFFNTAQFQQNAHAHMI